MENSAYETAKFFNLTKDFANKSIPDRDSRHSVIESVYTYLKNDLTATFTVQEFAERHVPLALRDKYEAFMKVKQFPDRAILRNTTELKARLRRRRFTYGTDIELSVSPEAIADRRVIIEVQPGDQGAGDKEVEVTKITINAPFTKER